MAVETAYWTRRVRTRTREWATTYLGPLTGLGAGATAIASFVALDQTRLRGLIAEGAVVEDASALLYFLAAAFLAVRARAHVDSRFHAAFAVVIVVLGLRELDFHAHFTSENVTKLSYYGDPSVAVDERVVAAAIMVCILAGLIAYAIAYASRLHAAVRRRSAAGISVLTAVVLLPTTKVLDRLPNRLEEGGLVMVSDTVGLLVSSAEEWLELAIPFVLVIAIAQTAFRRRSE